MKCLKKNPRLTKYIPFGILLNMEKDFSTKNKIIQVSLKLFSEKGYDAIGVQEIVTKCGITKPTLYYYFGSKLGLLQEIVNSFGGELYKRISSKAKYDYDFIKNLTDILYTVVEFAKEVPDFFKFHNALLFYPSDNEAYKVHYEIQKKINKCFEDLFINGTAQLGNMKGYELLFAYNFQIIVMGTACSVLNGEEVNDDTIYRVVRAFLYGVAN